MKAQDKPRLHTTLVKQFPNAFLKVTERCMLGHIEHAELDYDFQGFSRLPVEEYEEALVRHLMRLGNDTEIEHMAAVAWNALAILEIKLRYGKSNS